MHVNIITIIITMEEKKPKKPVCICEPRVCARLIRPSAYYGSSDGSCGVTVKVVEVVVEVMAVLDIVISCL